MLNEVTFDNDILADTVQSFGPCLNDEGETNVPVWFPKQPCNLFLHLPVESAGIQQAGYYADPRVALGH